jgi:succinate dehydrogenase/fumarate reductase-like Fe-S protein
LRCRTILNCADVCPKGLNPSLAIGKIKDMIVRREVSSSAHGRTSSPRVLSAR